MTRGTITQINNATVLDIAEAVSKSISPTNSIDSPFIDTADACILLGGGTRKISRMTFNDIRRKAPLKTYYVSSRRVVFSRQEILDYIASRGK